MSEGQMRTRRISGVWGAGPPAPQCLSARGRATRDLGVGLRRAGGLTVKSIFLRRSGVYGLMIVLANGVVGWRGGSADGRRPPVCAAGG